MGWRRRVVVTGVLALLILALAVPVARRLANPPTGSSAHWSRIVVSPDDRTLWVRSDFSNCERFDRLAVRYESSRVVIDVLTKQLGGSCLDAASHQDRLILAKELAGRPIETDSRAGRGQVIYDSGFPTSDCQPVATGGQDLRCGSLSAAVEAVREADGA